MLSRRLGRDLLWCTAAKVIALAMLYVLFFGPSHRPAIDPVAQIAGRDAASLSSTLER